MGKSEEKKQGVGGCSLFTTSTSTSSSEAPQFAKTPISTSSTSTSSSCTSALPHPFIDVGLFTRGHRRERDPCRRHLHKRLQHDLPTLEYQNPWSRDLFCNLGLSSAWQWWSLVGPSVVQYFSVGVGVNRF